MARKRSWRELKKIEEYTRKRSLEGRGGALTDKANYMATKFADNIANSKSGKRNSERYKAAYDKNDSSKQDKIREAALNRKYSANTYKGINAG